MTDRELQRHRSTHFSRWRDEKTGCTYLPSGRPLHHKMVAGRILNDPDDIETIAKNLRKKAEKEWTHPQTGIVYIPTWVVEQDYAISSQELETHTKRPSTFLGGDGLFHPIYRENGKSVRGCKRRWWPKGEVDSFCSGRDKLRSALDRAKQCVLGLVAKGPIKASEGIKALKDANFSAGTYRKALRQLKQENKIAVACPAKGLYFWHSKEHEPPTNNPKRAAVTRFLRSLLANGPIRAREGMSLCRQEGFTPRLVHDACREAGIHTTSVGKPHTSNWVYVWHYDNQDPKLLLSIPAADHAPAEVPEAQMPPPQPAPEPEAAKRSHGGRRPDPETQRCNEVCYEIYMSGIKMSLGLREAKRRVGESAPKEWKHLRLYAQRWANHDPDNPLSLDRKTAENPVGTGGTQN